MGKGGKAYFIKAQKAKKGRIKISIIVMKQGEIGRLIKTCHKHATFISNGVVDLEKQVEVMCFHLLHQ